MLHRSNELIAREIYSSILFHVHDQVFNQNAFPRLHPGMQFAAKNLISRNPAKFSECSAVWGMVRGKFQDGFEAFDFAFLLSQSKDAFQEIFGHDDCKRVAFHGASGDEGYLELQCILKAIQVPVLLDWNVTKYYFVTCFCTVLGRLEKGVANWEASHRFIVQLLE